MDHCEMKMDKASCTYSILNLQKKTPRSENDNISDLSAEKKTTSSLIESRGKLTIIFVFCLFFFRKESSFC